MIVAANRDEFYNRKTASADYWNDHPQILGGRDLEGGGTWLAMTKQGRISLITNYRDPKNINPKAPSRGKLVTDYLTSDLPPEDYLSTLAKADQYNGFNLLVGNQDQLWYFSNYKKGMDMVTAGLHGLSNHLLETPWPKVENGKKKMNELLKSPNIYPDELFDLLYDDRTAPDELLPETGVGLERERMLSSMFIKSPNYGTRCSTVILVDHSNKVSFSERVYDLKNFEYSTKAFQFKVR